MFSINHGAWGFSIFGSSSRRVIKINEFPKPNCLSSLANWCSCYLKKQLGEIISKGAFLMLKSVNSNFTLAVRSPKLWQAKSVRVKLEWPDFSI